jgi:hypothetical protein
MLWYNPTLDQDMPRWVYASFAIGLFLYQTFDAIDGTQAYVSSCPSCFFFLGDTPLLPAPGTEDSSPQVGKWLLNP